MPRRVLGYARVSSVEQALGTSLKDQQASIAAHVGERGTIQFFVEAESGVGEKLERRVQMTALMAALRKGDLVVCDKLDRWSRDTEHTLRSVREIREAGATFVAVHERYDSSTPDGDLMLTIRAALAKEEHARIKLRMVGTRRLVRDKGYYVEGTPPLGYRRAHPKGYKGIEKNVLVIVPEQAAIVRKIFALYLSGKSMTAIATKLDLRLDRVKDALHRRVYTGEVQDSNGAWIPDRHEAIIDAATFVRAQALIGVRRKGERRSPDRPCETSDWILREIARCSCGAKASAAYAGPKDARRYYYRCSKRCTSTFTRVDVVEANATFWIQVRLAEVADQIKAAGKTPKRAQIDARADIANRKEKLARKRARSVDAYTDGAITREELKARVEKIDAERLRLDAEESEASNGLADPAVRRKFAQTTADMWRAWGRATNAGKRAIVKALATSVDVVGPATSEPVWRKTEELAQIIPALVDAIETALATSEDPDDDDGVAVDDCDAEYDAIRKAYS